MLRGRGTLSSVLSFLRDEKGAIISSELVAVMTIGGLALFAGLHEVGEAINSEFEDIAVAIRCLDQSYEYVGVSNGKACVSGSSYLDLVTAQDCAPLEVCAEALVPCWETIECLRHGHDQHPVASTEPEAK